MFAPSMTQELDALETRKREMIEAAHGEVFAASTPLLHPGLAQAYRKKVEDLTEALEDEAMRTEATELIRYLIEEIRMIPTDDGLLVELVGELASILALGQEQNQFAALYPSIAAMDPIPKSCLASS